MWIAEAFDRVENISVEKLHSIVKTQGMLDDLIGPFILVMLIHLS
jgi:hypothetical protein